MFVKLLRSGAVACALVLSTVSAQAADLYSPRGGSLKDDGPAPRHYLNTWSGFYLGAHIGAGWLESDGSYVYNGPIGVPSSGSANFDDTSFLGGVQAGVNWQNGSWVFGVEVDYSWMEHTSSKEFFRYPAAPADHFDGAVQMDGAGSLRARIGWASGPVLLYLAGGLAFADVSVSHAFVRDGAFATWGEKSGWATGWTIGGGLEYMIARNWTLRGEYRYADYGSYSVTRDLVIEPSTARYDLTTHEVRMGLNYKF
jgi:outer membrane immunogenic protein